jgi:hypothetical protein
MQYVERDPYKSPNLARVWNLTKALLLGCIILPFFLTLCLIGFVISGFMGPAVLYMAIIEKSTFDRYFDIVISFKVYICS